MADMLRWSDSRRVPRVVVLLPLANLLINVLAAMLAPPQRPDQYFRETELITWLDSIELFLAGILGCLTWEWAASPLDRRANRFWLLSGLCLVYLSADEFLQYHEHLGLWLTRTYAIHAPRLIGPLDNLILILYAALGALLALWYRKRLLASRPTLLLLLLGGASMAISQLADEATSGLLYSKGSGLAFLQAQVVEESFKFLATGFLLAAMLAEFFAASMLSRAVGASDGLVVGQPAPAELP
jgi:hypothetical protein